MCKYRRRRCKRWKSKWNHNRFTKDVVENSLIFCMDDLYHFGSCMLYVWCVCMVLGCAHYAYVFIVWIPSSISHFPVAHATWKAYRVHILLATMFVAIIVCSVCMCISAVAFWICKFSTPELVQMQTSNVSFGFSYVASVWVVVFIRNSSSFIFRSRVLRAQTLQHLGSVQVYR